MRVGVVKGRVWVCNDQTIKQADDKENLESTFGPAEIVTEKVGGVMDDGLWSFKLELFRLLLLLRV